MNSPPGESRPGRAALPEDLLLADGSHDLCIPQVRPATLHVWFDEAQRIAAEYRRSGSVRHLRAFVQQVIGVMQQIESVLPR
jgi:hypothetical protein